MCKAKCTQITLIDRIIHHILQLRSNWIKRARADLLLPPGLVGIRIANRENPSSHNHLKKQNEKKIKITAIPCQPVDFSFLSLRGLSNEILKARTGNIFVSEYTISNLTLLRENYNSILKLHTWGWWCFHALCSSFSLSTGSTWTALSVAILNLSAIESKLRPQHKWSDDKQWQRDSRVCGVWQHVMWHRFAQFQSVLHLLGSF